jgi:hypothetical protein
MRIIDPPTPFHSVAEWRGFLNEMLELQKQDSEDTQLAEVIANARAEIARIKKEGDPFARA